MKVTSVGGGGNKMPAGTIKTEQKLVEWCEK